MKNLPAMGETQVWFLGLEDPLEKGMATYSSILAWRIPWTEEPGELQSIGSQRVRHDWETNIHTHTQRTRYLKLMNWALFCVWEDARVGAHWNHSFDMHLSYLGPVSWVFTSWVSSGFTLGSGCSLMAARWQVLFCFLSSLRAPPLTLGNGCNHRLWQPLFTDTEKNRPLLTSILSERLSKWVQLKNKH